MAPKRFSNTAKLALLVGFFLAISGFGSPNVLSQQDNDKDIIDKFETLRTRLPIIIRDWGTRSLDPNAKCPSVIAEFGRVRRFSKCRGKIVVYIHSQGMDGKKGVEPLYRLQIDIAYYDGNWTTIGYQWSPENVLPIWKDATCSLMDIIDTLQK